MRQLIVICACLLASTAALPCSIWFPNFSDFGPAEWSGREDVPANWVFTAAGVREEFGSWWAKKREDGAEFRRLEIAFDPQTSVMQIFPPEPFEAGARYEVASFVQSDEELSANDLVEFEPILTGSFTVVPEDDIAPAKPIILESSSQPFIQYEPGSLCEEEFIAATTVQTTFLNEGVAALHIREVSTGALVEILRPGVTREEVTFRYTTKAGGVRPLTVQAFDLAGNASPTLHFLGDAGGEGACSGTGQGESFVGLFFLTFFLRRRCKLATRSNPLHGDV